MEVELKYHPNIIGKKGATINKIRDDHDVKIQLPDKESGCSEIIITGESLCVPCWDWVGMFLECNFNMQ